MADIQILAPLDGTVVALEAVPDEVFAQKMVGDGVAIEPTGSVAVAPAAGHLAKLFEDGHAFGLRLESGVEIIVHLGLDTTDLKGAGFEKLVSEGEMVAAGQPIVRFDRAVIEQAGLPLVSPIVSAGPGLVVQHASGTVRAGQDVLFVVQV